MVREEWLRRAVEELDNIVFGGDLDIYNHEYQISCGKCKSTETIQPYEGEDVRLEDFFPTTILISHSINDPIEMLGKLALECIHAFFNEKGNTKRFKQLAEKYYFEKPFSSYNPSVYLVDLLEQVYDNVKNDWGEWPGKTVVVRPKEKSNKKNSYSIFCNECGYEMKVTRKIYDKYGGQLPTCACGCKMAVDLGDEQEEQQGTEN